MPEINLKIVVWREGKQFVAWCLNNGVSSFGESKSDAIKSLNEALDLYFEDVSISDVVDVESPDIVPIVYKYA